MNSILIIEDDNEICLMIKDHLEKYNYHVSFISTGANAVEQVKKISPDLIILDLMLPYINGDELLRQIRTFSEIPVIVVSAKSLTFNKIELLRLGADDYLTKPFNLDELAARIERNLIRSQKNTPCIAITVGELLIDTSSKTVEAAGEILPLTAKEYQIIELLAKYPDKVFSKQNLYESIWQEPFARDNDVINTHISNLRKKLKAEGNRIQTVWGLGYRLNK
ncbi:response regulator transcription factor [Diplocloster hominis]|uniref:response regulator transcription factor n=1 Tax=Diplocloster hominis TaxID=3079010 RepID=UPI0031BA45E1